jgi:hypothetical protein
MPQEETKPAYRSNTPKGMPSTPKDLYEGAKETYQRLKNTLGNMLGSKAARMTDIELLPPGMIQSGNIDLYAQPIVRNQDGTTSTVDSSSYNIDGQEVLLSSVTPDGRHLRNPQAIIAEYRKTGRFLGKFETPQAATAYAQRLHEDYANGRYDKSSRAQDGRKR